MLKAGFCMWVWARRHPEKVVEQSHASVAGQEGLPMVHLLYNGIDHYDALVETPFTPDMVPAWSQPPPPKYMEVGGGDPAPPAAADEFPCLAAAAAQPNGKQRRKFAAPKPSKPKAAKPTAAAAQPAAARHHRYSQKTTPAPALQSTLLDDLVTASVAETSSHPHRQVEDAIQAVGACVQNPFPILFLNKNAFTHQTVAVHPSLRFCTKCLALFTFKFARSLPRRS